MAEQQSITGEASQLFGEDAGPRLAAVLSQGNESIDDRIRLLREQNRILSNETVAAARAVNDSLGEMQDQFETELTRTIADNAEDINELAATYYGLTESVLTSTGGIIDSLDEMATAFATTADIGRTSAFTISTAFDIAGKILGAAAAKAVAMAQGEFDRAEAIKQAFLSDLEQTNQEVLDFDTRAHRDELARIREQQEARREAFQERKKEQETLMDLERLMQDESLFAFGGGRGGAGDDTGDTPEPTGEGDAAAMMRERNDAMREAARLTEQLRTPQEEYNDAIRDLYAMEPWLDQETMNRAVAMYAERLAESRNESEKLADKHEEEMDRMTEFTIQAARNMEDAMSDFFFDAMQGDLNDLAGSFKKTIDRMVADMLAQRAAMELFGNFGETGEVGGIVGNLASSFMGSFAGGGHTGNEPRSGGLDGRGGFLAMMHPRERVIDETKQGGQTTQEAPVTIHMNVNGVRDSGDLRKSSGQVAAKAAQAVQRGRRNL